MLGPNQIPTDRHLGSGPRPYNILAQILLPQIDPELWKKTATTQTKWDLLSALCQLQAHTRRIPRIPGIPDITPTRLRYWQASPLRTPS